MENEGIKYDEGKPDISLIPYSALEEEAYAFMLGMKKYGRYNFTKGMAITRVLASAMRHILAFLWEQSWDEESGRSHLGHARACLAMAIEMLRIGTATDDRPDYVKRFKDAA